MSSSLHTNHFWEHFNVLEKNPLHFKSLHSQRGLSSKHCCIIYMIMTFKDVMDTIYLAGNSKNICSSYFDGITSQLGPKSISPIEHHYKSDSYKTVNRTPLTTNKGSYYSLYWDFLIHGGFISLSEYSFIYFNGLAVWCIRGKLLTLRLE